MGVVLEESSKGKFSPLFGASVFWSGTTDGVSTDSTGSFSISFPADSANGRRLVVRFLGYESDTLEVTSNDKLKIILASQ